jgi:hypothetical protein
MCKIEVRETQTETERRGQKRQRPRDRDRDRKRERKMKGEESVREGERGGERFWSAFKDDVCGCVHEHSCHKPDTLNLVAHFQPASTLSHTLDLPGPQPRLACV